MKCINALWEKRRFFQTLNSVVHIVITVPQRVIAGGTGSRVIKQLSANLGPQLQFLKLMKLIIFLVI
jgi:hypothetical protein